MSWIEQAREDLAEAIRVIPGDYGTRLIEMHRAKLISEWVPQIDRDKLTEREIHIAPQTRETRLASRSYRIVAVDVSVAIVDPFEQGQENKQTSGGHELADAIIDGLLGKRIGGANNMICVAAEQTVTTSVEHWRANRMFASFLNLKLES